MTEPLQRAVAEIEKQPADVRDAIAARILEELADERRWDALFAATSDDQWARMAAILRRDIAAGAVAPLDEVFSAKTFEP